MAESFEQFMADRLAALIRFATVLTDDPALAEDLCQDVLIKARGRWEEISSLEHPYAYVRRMLVNEHVSWRRKWARIVPRSHVAVADVSPDHAGAVAEHEQVLALVRTLPERQRTALVLRYFEDLPNREIAQVMGCRETTVRGYIHRGLQALRIDYGLGRDPHLPPGRTLTTEGLS